jgi:hypothetical protein
MGWIDGGAHAATSSPSTAVTSTCGASENPSRYRHPLCAGKKTLTCADWSTAKAGALKAVLCGTDYRVETEADGAPYEAYMTKADGTHVDQ